MRLIYSFTAFVWLVCGGAAAAQEPWLEPFHSDVDALLAAADSVEPLEKALSDTFFEHTRYQLDSNRRRTITTRSVYRVIKTAPGAPFMRVRARWAPWYQDRPEIRARVITADGRERWLDPETLSEQAAPAVQSGAYESVRNIAAPLPAIAEGALVEVEIRTRDRRAVLDAPHDETFSLSDRRHVLQTVLELDAPADSDLGWKLEHEEQIEVEQRSEGKRRQVVFTHQHQRPQPPATPKPGMRFRSGDGAAVHFSTGGTWREVAADYHRLTEKQLDGKPLPGDWPAPGGDRRQFIKNLVRQMHQKVRYEALELGQAAIEPRPPTVTLARGYGDCKDKSLLLKGLLAEAGVESRLVLVRAGHSREQRKDVDPDLPGFGRFNHVILHLPSGSPDEEALWIDATAHLTPIGELPSAVQGRWGLIIDPDTSELVEIPGSEAADNQLIYRSEVTFGSDGSRIVRGVHQTTGVRSERTRDRAARNPEQFESEFRFLSGDFKGELELESLTPDDPAALDSTFAVSFTLTGKPKGASYSPDWVDFVHPAQLLFQGLPAGGSQPEDRDDGSDTAELRTPFRSQVETRIVPAPGFKLRGLPKSERRTFGPAVLETSAREEDDGAVVVVTKFDSSNGEMSKQEADDYRKALQTFNRRNAERLVLEHEVFLGLRTSSFGAALEAAQELVRRNPEEMLARTRLVDALLLVGAGQSARDEARRLVADFPDEAAAHMALGAALSHDILGRRFSANAQNRGFDRDGAVAAYQQALELDPEGRKPLLELVEALSYAPDGSRVGSSFDGGQGSRAEEAVALVRSELEREGRPAVAPGLLRQQLGILLSFMGRYEELAEFAASDVRSFGAHAVEAATMLEGLDAGIAAADEYAGREPRSSLLWQAADRLESTRHYPEAAALYEAVATASGTTAKQAAYYQNKARLASNTQRHEELWAESSEPERLVQTWLQLPLRDDWREQQLKLSGSACGEREQRNPEAEREFERYSARGRYGNHLLGPARKRILDTILSFNELTVEGDAQSGYWVRGYGVPSSGRRTISLLAFLEEQDGELKILDATSARRFSLSDLGCNLLRRLDAGGLEAVMVWLDRLADAYHPGLAGLQTFWCDNCDRTEADARIALALLQTADSTLAASILPLLEQAYAGEEGLDRQVVLVRALASARGSLGEREAAAEALTQFAQAQPILTPAVLAAVQAQARLGRTERARAILQAGLAESPDNLELLRAQLWLATGSGDAASAAETIAQLEGMGRVQWPDYNNAAWAAVAAGEGYGEALEQVEKALTTAQVSHAALNTKAALLALTGELDQARARWHESVHRSRTTWPSDGDEFVAGLILEGYGLLADARLAYERALEASPGEPEPGGSAALARQALERLAQ